ncbi:glycosyltransferase family 2 protein [Xanthobacter versatilis]|uniref:Glycosyl transferase family 2 n=1 Tax=Xanthobacter autotrophicus (strain ATCC BAA-1158 / Py2) TaxID=78245 RepID=A7IL95_XANP2|nr:glycosyl transferase family 2 [Xanthobacter autotrophicus Py2]
MDRAVVVIPTYNASRHLGDLLPALQQQGLRPDQYFVIDSSSGDDTLARVGAFGARTHRIDKKEFNHGGTRRLAANLNPEAEFLIYMTQDAIPEPGAIKRLLEAFADDKVGVAYGRQLPRAKSSAIERHARLANYPAINEVRSIEDASRLGIKTVFCSNSFAAYRRTALEGVGNFPEDNYFAEDQVVSGRMLLSGWRIAYVGDAAVVHSHDYTIKEDFRRYFDVGVFHGRNPWLLEKLGKAEGAGMAFIKSETAYLLKHDPLALPSAGVRTLAKYVAYKLGQREAKLSPKTKAFLSMQPGYWRNQIR